MMHGHLQNTKAPWLEITWTELLGATAEAVAVEGLHEQQQQDGGFHSPLVPAHAQDDGHLHAYCAGKQQQVGEEVAGAGSSGRWWSSTKQEVGVEQRASGAVLDCWRRRTAGSSKKRPRTNAPLSE